MLTQEFLKSVELFAGLGEADASALAALGREEVYRKGDIIFRERDPGDRLYVLVSGVVELSRTSTAPERLLPRARLERGEILDEIAAFDRAPRSATAAAAMVPETRLASWGHAEFHAFLASHPAAAAAIMGALLRRMSLRLRQTSEAIRVLLRALEASPA